MLLEGLSLSSDRHGVREADGDRSCRSCHPFRWVLSESFTELEVKRCLKHFTGGIKDVSGCSMLTVQGTPSQTSIRGRRETVVFTEFSGRALLCVPYLHANVLVLLTMACETEPCVRSHFEVRAGVGWGRYARKYATESLSTLHVYACSATGGSRSREQGATSLFIF